LRAIVGLILQLWWYRRRDSDIIRIFISGIMPRHEVGQRLANAFRITVYLGIFVVVVLRILNHTFQVAFQGGQIRVLEAIELVLILMLRQYCGRHCSEIVDKDKVLIKKPHHHHVICRSFAQKQMARTSRDSRRHLMHW